jgi:hypothetical protein
MPETPIILFTLYTELHADSICEAIGVDFVSKVDGIPKLLERVDALFPQLSRTEEQPSSRQ